MSVATLPLTIGAIDGRTLGKYDVLCRLSTGGMSEIYLAFQKGLAGFKKIVVLKSILPDIRGEEEFVRMFLDEAKITAAFNHPNIAQVFDLDVDQGVLFLAMEFVPGCTLVEIARACRNKGEAIPVGFTIQAVRDTALALHYAHNFTDPLGHKQTVIHRDVAEKNIMVTYEGTTKLLDFGIAKSLNRAGRTSVGMVKGTSGYMSPEQILGEKLDPRSDIFALGVVLHECLTGMRLFHGKSPEAGMIAAIKEEATPPSAQNPLVPKELDEVVLKSLRKKRDDRFATALEFARAIEKACGPLIWHPEQTGELVQRLFSDRREQTRTLLEQAHSQGKENTGEVRIDRLLKSLDAPQEAPASSSPPKAPPARPPGTSGSRTPPPPRPSNPGDEQGTAVLSPTVAPFPGPRPPSSPPQERTDENFISEVPTPLLQKRPGTRPTPPAGSPAANAGPVTQEPPKQRASQTGAAALQRGPPSNTKTVAASAPDFTPTVPPQAKLDDDERPWPTLPPEDDTTANNVLPGSATVIGELPDEDTMLGDLRPAGRFGAASSVIVGVVIALAIFAAGIYFLGLYRELPFFSKSESSVTTPVAKKASIEEAAAQKAAAKKAAAEKLAAEKASAAKAAADKLAAEKAAEEKASAEKAAADKAAAEQAALAAKKKAIPPPPRPKPAPVQTGTGFLTLVATPFARILFNSKELGTTPLVKASLPVGKHTIQLVDETGAKFSMPVEITTGEVTKLKVSLSELKPD